MDDRGEGAGRHAFEEGGEIAFQEGEVGTEVVEHGLTIVKIADGEGDVVAGPAGEAGDFCRPAGGVWLRDAADFDPGADEPLLAGELVAGSGGVHEVGDDGAMEAAVKPAVWESLHVCVPVMALAEEERV